MAVACQGRTALIARPSCPAWCWTRRTDVIFLWYQKLSAKREIGAAATQQSTIFRLFISIVSFFIFLIFSLVSWNFCSGYMCIVSTTECKWEMVIC
jgi:hypothetical protein